jgi:hypothetical protein
VNKLNSSKTIAAFAMGAALLIPTLLPADAMAQNRGSDRRSDRNSNDRRDAPRSDRHQTQRAREADNRQTQKNNWRNLGIAGGVVGAYGLITGNKTLAALGIGGGLYSASRYEADRKSQNSNDHKRYELFNRDSFDYNGHRYVRQTKTVNGKKNFYFHRDR